MEIVQTPIAEIFFDKNNSILNIKVIEGAEMTLENTKEHYQKINSLVGDRKYLALVDAGNYYSVEKQAWEYASSKEVASNRLAAAHFNSSSANRLTTSFFKTAYDTPVPVQIFETKEEALAWLSSFSLE